MITSCYHGSILRGIKPDEQVRLDFGRKCKYLSIYTEDRQYPTTLNIPGYWIVRLSVFFNCLLAEYPQPSPDF